MLRIKVLKTIPLFDIKDVDKAEKIQIKLYYAKINRSVFETRSYATFETCRFFLYPMFWSPAMRFDQKSRSL
ncbi:hypothetical protein DERP_005874 [Dermatophagoides pteronyssinus]|uniref:Uncharacterized protein n=1 Tax=Dermatophagoides pteronyssinus TaxID=6956 RepID=A0ABQ8J9S7_DERPT|nr:hypothetical protein DERP_005874 [Dermatophagoides pteronyssinus]